MSCCTAFGERPILIYGLGDQGILERFPILPIDLSTARVHAQLWAELESKGIMIGLHDSWLAATCIANGYTLATGNFREFRRVPGLTVECWFEQESIGE